jgi:ATP/maltotriose-dependent transcriptional regulator MalT
MQGLIRAVQPRLKDAHLAAFAGELLTEFSGEAEAGAGSLLSERELEVLRLVAEGLSNREIAERLYVSVRTVKFHTGNVFGKLGAANRTQAVKRAREAGLLGES